MSDTADPGPVLQERFGFRAFLEGQETIVRAILDGEDALVIMPTGGGKSLCYQLPAMLLEGITVVVSPLIALMKDQVDGLVAKGIPATYVNSSLGPSEIDDRIRRLSRGEYRLVYIAPERFKSPRFVDTLAPLSIALFAVDEAHCISQWGHDFRPDYLRLRGAIEALGRPQVAALTATATPEVRDDILAQLELGGNGRRPPRVFVTGFARPNLALAVSRVSGRADKLDRIGAAIREGRTGIVYCATRKNVERVAAHLKETGVAAVAYHGGMGEELRTRAQERFMEGKVGVAVATNAFGMGIDRADLRFVVHFDIPGSVEAYYQEAGRAGRDGEPARCELLYNYADVATQEFFLLGSNPSRAVVEDVREVLRDLCADGPIEMPIDGIAGRMPGRPNAMAVGSSLLLLERAGFLRRDYRTGSRTYTTEVVEPAKTLEELGLDFARLDRKRERDEAKLRRMIQYADHPGCRHGFILAYFGDPEAGKQCPACDNCRSRAPGGARLPDAAEAADVRKALDCVARLDGRFGRGRIAQTLAGSRSKEVLDLGLDRLPVYGTLEDCGQDGVWALLNALVRAGCLEVGEGEYPTVSLTDLGRDVLEGKTEVPVELAAADNGGGPKRRAKGKSAAARKGADRPEKVAAAEGPVDARLFEALRQWRREKAFELGGVPAYLIYPDKTLENLARLMPRTHSDLLQVRGIGPAKAHQFGVETLDIVRGHLERRST